MPSLRILCRRKCTYREFYESFLCHEILHENCLNLFVLSFLPERNILYFRCALPIVNSKRNNLTGHYLCGEQSAYFRDWAGICGSQALFKIFTARSICKRELRSISSLLVGRYGSSAKNFSAPHLCEKFFRNLSRSYFKFSISSRRRSFSAKSFFRHSSQPSPPRVIDFAR